MKYIQFKYSESLQLGSGKGKRYEKNSDQRGNKEENGEEEK